MTEVAAKDPLPCLLVSTFLLAFTRDDVIEQMKS